ncbi:hypothetical protein JCM1840_005603 [Sporobolomyces johnsonii]
MAEFFVDPQETVSFERVSGYHDPPSSDNLMLVTYRWSDNINNFESTICNIVPVARYICHTHIIQNNNTSAPPARKKPRMGSMEQLDPNLNVDNLTY